MAELTYEDVKLAAKRAECMQREAATTHRLGNPCSGHKYVQIGGDDWNAILKCEHCGHISIAGVLCHDD